MPRTPVSALLAPVIGIAALLGAAACAPIVNTRGNMVDPERLAEIKPGTTADQVLSLLGTPTTMGTFDNHTWYYIGQVTESHAFSDPTVVERRVLAIRFNQSGTVTDVRNLDKSAGQEVEIVDRSTPTAGHELGFLEQLVGNVGKFNPSQKNAGVGPTRSPGVPSR